MSKNKKKTAAVIGAGFGGIATALRLIKRGYEVSLIDQHPYIGGKAGILNSGPFSYDTGPTVITASYLIDELFHLFGKKTSDFIDLVPVTPWYRYQFQNGTLLDYDSLIEEKIAEIFPDQLSAYQDYCKYTEALYKEGFDNYGALPFNRLSQFLGALPKLLRLKATKSVLKTCRSFFNQEELVQAFAIPPLLVGGDPRKTPAIYLLIHHLEKKWGVRFPKGGTANLCKALQKLFEEEGGKLYLNTKVEGIDLAYGNQVRGVKIAGEQPTLPADLVVFNGDPRALYKNLLPGHGKNPLTYFQVNRFKSSMGLFVLFFSTSKRYQEVPHHLILMGSEFEGHLEAIFDRGSLHPHPNLYLHRPCATDPNRAPDGHDSFYALVPVPNLTFPIDWDVESTRYKERILAILEENCLPNLRGHLVDQHVKTPADFASHELCYQGAPFTIAPSLTQSAYLRFPHQVRGFENLYCVGAGTHPGAGLPGVLSSAKALEKVIL